MTLSSFTSGSDLLVVIPQPTLTPTERQLALREGAHWILPRLPMNLGIVGATEPRDIAQVLAGEPWTETTQQP